MEPAIPPELLSRVRAARSVVELAAGRRFGFAEAVQAAAPGVDILITDVDAAVLDAPPPLRALVDDLLAPDLARYGRPDLLYALRLPEELQPAAARLARRLDAPLALRPLKDEWADLRPHLVERERWSGGWRWFEPPR